MSKLYPQKLMQIITEDMSWWNISASFCSPTIVQNTTILTIGLVQLCTVPANEHTKKERNDIWLQCCLCCTSSVKLLWPESQLDVIIRSNCIKGYSSTDRFTNYKSIDIFFHLVSFIHWLQAGIFLLLLYVCADTSTRAALTLNSPFNSCDYWSAQWPRMASCTQWDVTCCCLLLSGSRWLEGWRRTSGPPRSHCKWTVTMVMMLNTVARCCD